MKGKKKLSLKCLNCNLKLVSHTVITSATNTVSLNYCSNKNCGRYRLITL